MAMNDVRWLTTAFSASITIHFFSTSAGFSEAVVFIMRLVRKNWVRPRARRSAARRPRCYVARGLLSPADAHGAAKALVRQGVAECGIMLPATLGRRARCRRRPG